MTRQLADLLVLGGTVLTMDGDNRMLEHAGIAISNDQIIALASNEALQASYQAERIIEARNHVIMPGLIDTYGHAGHGLIRGLWHPEHGWPAGELYWHGTTENWWYAEALLAACERLRFGVTTGLSIIGSTPARVDSPVFARRNAEAYAKVGGRAVLGVGPPDPFFSHLPEPWSGSFFEHGQWVERPFSYEDALANTVQVINDWHQKADGRIHIALAPPYLFGRHVAHPRHPNQLPGADQAPVMLEKAEEMRALADRYSVLIHTHMFKGSVMFALEHFGQPTVNRLLGTDVVIAHGNGLEPNEVEVIGQNKCSVATVAYTHENLWYGYAPVVELLEAGANVTISTDGAAPYTSLDLLRELSRALWNQWNVYKDQRVLPISKTLRMVTIDAAKALGLEDQLGSLEVGKKADIITVNLAKPHLTPRTFIPRLLTNYAQGQDVDTVLVDGKVLMKGGQIQNVDKEEVIAFAEQEARQAFAHIDLNLFSNDGEEN